MLQNKIPQRVSLLTFGVKDMEKMRAFYRALGWQEREGSNEHYAVFLTAGVLLSLFPREELEKDAGISFTRSDEGYSNVTFAVNVDKPEDVDAAMEVAVQAGAVVLRAPSDAFWGGRTAYFADPERNLWEVAWNPTAVFDERGTMISF